MDGIEFERGELVTTCTLHHKGAAYRIGCFSNEAGMSGRVSISPGCRSAETLGDAWGVLLMDAQAKSDFLALLDGEAA